MDWIREMKKEDIFNMRDEQGNTVLHLATLKKQRQASPILYLIPYSIIFNQFSSCFYCFQIIIKECLSLDCEATESSCLIKLH